ncbi:hypothetical protein ACF1BU_38735, partial [Streptomyces sp. NPDC014724]
IDPMTYIAKGAGAGLSKIGDITKGLKGISNIDIPKLPDDAITLPEGSFKLPDGTVHLPEGAAIPEGGIKLPDGNVKFPDGAPVLPEGTTKLPTGPGEPARYFDSEYNLLDENGNVLQKAGDARPEGPLDIRPDDPSTDTPHTDTPAREPALVGAGAHTADNAAHAAASSDQVIHLGDSLGNDLGDIGRVGDDLNGPTSHVGDNLPGGHADDLGHSPSANHEPPTGHHDGSASGQGDGPGAAGGHDSSASGHGEGPSSSHETPATGHGDGPGGGGGDGPGGPVSPGSDGPGNSGSWDKPSHESGPLELGGKTEQLIRDQLRGSKVKPGDLDKALANLADHPSGQEMANLIASGRFKGLENYDQVVSSFTQKNGMSGGIEQLRLAERLQGSGVKDISFEIKKEIEIKPGVVTGPRTDMDVMARGADGKVYGYQFKEVANPKKVTSKMWQNIGQLADSGADVKVFVVDTKGSMADMLAQGVEKDLARIHAEKGVTVVLRVEDGTLMYPPGSNFMPGGRP